MAGSGSRLSRAPPRRTGSSKARLAGSPAGGIFCPGGPDDEHAGPQSDARSQPPGAVGAPAMRPAEPGPLRGLPARPTEDEADLALMRRIDELFLAHPFLGSRRMAKMLSREGA